MDLKTHYFLLLVHHHGNQFNPFMTNALIPFSLYFGCLFLLGYCTRHNVCFFRNLVFKLILHLICGICNLGFSICCLDGVSFFSILIDLRNWIYGLVSLLISPFLANILVLVDFNISRLFLLWLLLIILSLSLFGWRSFILINLLFSCSWYCQLAVSLACFLSDRSFKILRALIVLHISIGFSSSRTTARWGNERRRFVGQFLVMMLQGLKLLLFLGWLLKHLHLLYFVDEETKCSILVLKLFIKTKVVQLCLNVLSISFGLVGNLHLLMLNDGYFWEWLLGVQEFESRIWWLLTNHHVELGVFKSPYVNLLVDLLVQSLQFEAKICWAFSFNKAIAIIVDLGLNLQPNVWARLLSSLGKGCKVVVAYFVLVPPE